MTKWIWLMVRDHLAWPERGGSYPKKGKSWRNWAQSFVAIVEATLKGSVETRLHVFVLTKLGSLGGPFEHFTSLHRTLFVFKPMRGSASKPVKQINVKMSREPTPNVNWKWKSSTEPLCGASIFAGDLHGRWFFRPTGMVFSQWSTNIALVDE